VVSVSKVDGGHLGDVSERLDNLLQEIQDLGKKIHLHEMLQERRWELLESFGLCRK